MFTHTLDTAVGPVVVEFRPAGWSVAPTHVNVAERLSFAQQRVLCHHADEIHTNPLAAPAGRTRDLPAPAEDVKVADLRETLVNV